MSSAPQDWHGYPDDEQDDEDDENELEQPYTFDDIEVGMRGKYSGDRVWVVAKGENVSKKDTDTRHIKVAGGGDDKPRLIHEATVNRYLRKKNRLWIDWTDSMAPEK